MKLETKLKINAIKRRLLNMWYAAMKPVAKALDAYDKNKETRLDNKVKAMTECDVVERIVKITKKSLSRYTNGYKTIHIAKSTGDWTDRNIRDHMTDVCKEDKYVRRYGYNLKYDDIDTYRKLTEMLYDKLREEKVLDVYWKVYENHNYFWKGYEKTLCIKVKDEYRNK